MAVTTLSPISGTDELALLDEFAGQAMQAIVHHTGLQTEYQGYARWTDHAYLLAFDMMKSRRKFLDKLIPAKK